MAESDSASTSKHQDQVTAEDSEQDVEAEAQDQVVAQEIESIAASSHHQLHSHPQMGWDDSDQEDNDEEEDEEEEEEEEDGGQEEEENDSDQFSDQDAEESNGLHQIPSRAWADSSYDDSFAYHPNQEDDEETRDNAPLRLRSSKSRSNSLHPPTSSQQNVTFKSRLSSVWLYLTKGSSHSRGKGSGGGLPASLSLPLVSANLFAASLHPGVLLSMPYYFSLTGNGVGIAALMVIAIVSILNQRLYS